MAIDPRKLRPTRTVPAAELHAAGRGDQRAAVATAIARGPGSASATAGTSTCSATSPGWSQIRHAPKPEPDGDPYETLKERARARNAALSLAGRDIGELPAVVNPERKAQAAADFRFFCEAYFPLTFHLAWSPDHLKVIAQDRAGRAARRAVRDGHAARQRARRRSASAPASGRCSTATATSSA